MRRCALAAWVVFLWLAGAGAALAAPGGDDPRGLYQRAAKLDAAGEAEQALDLVNRGLAAAPRDLALLGLRGAVLLKLHDYASALAAYQAYLEAGATGANRRQAQKIVDNLAAVKSTFLDVTLASGPASIYLDSKTQGLFCTAAPTCHQAVLPGEYKLIAERPGYERWTQRIGIEGNKTSKFAVTLVEKPSQLTVSAPTGARITVDGAAYTAPVAVPAGSHQVAVALAGHVEARRTAVAHEGQPVELTVELAPLVAVRLSPPGVALRLDGKPVALDAGGLAIPPGAHVLLASARGFRDGRIEIPAVRAPDYQVAVELAPVEATRSTGPLSESTALQLSIEGTAASWAVVLVARATDQSGSDALVAVGAAGTLFAPSFGQWYAREVQPAGLGLRLVGLATGILSYSLNPSDTRTALLFGGGALYAAGTVYDIATIPRAVRRHNAEPQLAVVPIVRGAPGLLLSGSF
ncbi:MAG TPA: PEGA domain-containing protein [Kofleriaceae bacterium]|nr:PEGA domain-containing protein [Kofleriaceae bacterium]